MLRNSRIDRYSSEIRDGFQELYNICKCSESNSGNLLLCQQNGSIYRNSPVIGLGDEGLNNMQKINTLSFNGIGDMTDDDEYFLKNGNGFFNGTSEFENSINKEASRYLYIWENTFFIRVFTQVVNVLNGEHYNWHLNISKLSAPDKSKHIREQIIKRLTTVPKLHRIAQTAYVGQLRNAIGHSKYHCVQGGIILDNYNDDKYATLQGISFDEWEKKCIYSYLIFVGLFQFLEQIKNDFYIPLTAETLSGGIPILVPEENGKGWISTYIYPNKDGKIWRFTKVI